MRVCSALSFCRVATLDDSLSRRITCNISNNYYYHFLQYFTCIYVCSLVPCPMYACWPCYLLRSKPMVPVSQAGRVSSHTLRFKQRHLTDCEYIHHQTAKYRTGDLMHRNASLHIETAAAPAFDSHTAACTAIMGSTSACLNLLHS
jgi:hypothetical protein